MFKSVLLTSYIKTPPQSEFIFISAYTDALPLLTLCLIFISAELYTFSILIQSNTRILQRPVSISADYLKRQLLTSLINNHIEKIISVLRKNKCCGDCDFFSHDFDLKLHSNYPGFWAMFISLVTFDMPSCIAIASDT